MAEQISHFQELRVYENAMNLSMDIFELTKSFPDEETYSLVDQIRRSSRSICASIGESWHKRNYKKAFVSKLNNALSEASETQVWIEMAKNCGHISQERSDDLFEACEKIIAQLLKMINKPDQWILA